MDNPFTRDPAEYSVKDVAERNDHAELIKGGLVISDKTSVAHNNAVLEIAAAFKQFIAANHGKCRVFTENVALYCDELCSDTGNLFLPDVMTVCREEGIKDDGIHAAPTFVAEVTSESTKKSDYGRKMLTYCEIGVEEYWVVDLQRNVVVRYLARNDYAPEVFAYPHIMNMAVHSFPSLEIDLGQIFE